MEGVRVRLGLGCGAPAQIWEEFGGWRRLEKLYSIAWSSGKNRGSSGRELKVGFAYVSIA
jgi:hypothetical protein